MILNYIKKAQIKLKYDINKVYFYIRNHRYSENYKYSKVEEKLKHFSIIKQNLKQKLNARYTREYISIKHDLKSKDSTRKEHDTNFIKSLK